MKYFLIIGLVLILVASAGGAGQDDYATLGDYFNSFHSRISSYTPNLFRLDADSSEIRQAFNDALLDVSKLVGAAESKDTVVMDSSLWYDLPSDFQSIVRVAYWNDATGPGETALDPMPLGDMGRNTEIGVGTDYPAYYVVWGREIAFERNNYLLDSIAVYYRAYSKVLSANTDTSNVSMKYSNIVVDEAILLFYGGRVGAMVPQIIALADRRLARAYEKLNIEYKSITPDIK